MSIMQAPLTGTRLIRSHPLVNGIVHAWRATGHGTLTYDLMGSETLTTDVPGTEFTPVGPALDSTNHTKTLSEVAFTVPSSIGYSVVVVFRALAPASTKVLCAHYGTQERYRFQHLSTGNMRFGISQGTGVNLVNASFAEPPDGTVNCAAFRSTGDTGFPGSRGQIYMNGLHLNTINSDVSFQLASSKTGVGNDSSGGNDYGGNTLLVIYYNRPLADGELASITIDPWQIFDTRSSRKILLSGMSSAAPPSGTIPHLASRITTGHQAFGLHHIESGTI